MTIDPGQSNPTPPVGKRRPKLCIGCGSCQTQEYCSFFFKFVMLAGVFLTQLVKRKDLKVFKIASGSMFPTLKVNDFVLVEPIDQGMLSYDKLLNQTVVFLNPDYKEGKNHELLSKRIVAVPGNTVSLHRGKLRINGKIEPTQNLPAICNITAKTWTVPAGCIFLVGDNRNCSYDSIDYGPVSSSYLVGKIKFRYWPLWRFGRVR